MRLRADDLRTDGLVLELPAGEDATNVLRLGPSGGVTGVYEQDARRIVLGDIRGDELKLARVSWHLPGGRADTDEGAHLAGVRVDATVALQRGEGQSPFVGTVEIGEARLEAVSAVLAGVELRLEDVRLEGVDAHVTVDGSFELEVHRARAKRARLKRGTLEVGIDGLDLPTGFALRAGELALPRLSVREMGVRVADFAALRTANGRPAAEETPSDGNGEAWQNLRVLDALHGKVDVDLRVDATVPVIGRRRATHHFRIPISGGTIDYHELERDLADLEDAFIDFAVKKNRLILERDVPLLPFGSRTLLYWELESEHDRALADRKRVRLAKLAEPRVPPKREHEEVEEGKKGLVLRVLDFDGIDVELGLTSSHIEIGDDGRIDLGGPDGPALRRLEVSGDLRYQPGQPLDPTELRIAARELRAALERIPLGSRLMSSSAVRVGAVEDVALAFEGVRPSAAEAAIREVEIEGVQLTSAE